MRTVSVVIPTLNRPKHLKKLLHSLLAQTKLPDEVIIVDDSDDSRTEDLIISEHRNFSAEGVRIEYIRGGSTERSISRARNVGMRAASGEIVFFIDDDVVLDRRYVSEVLRVYSEHPNAIGVQGIWINMWERARAKAISTRNLLNSIRKAFLLNHWEEDSQRVLPSGDVVSSFPLTKTIEAEQISGGVTSFKRANSKGFWFDENLRGYS